MSIFVPSLIASVAIMSYFTGIHPKSSDGSQVQTAAPSVYKPTKALIFYDGNGLVSMMKSQMGSALRSSLTNTGDGNQPWAFPSGGLVSSLAAHVCSLSFKHRHSDTIAFRRLFTLTHLHSALARCSTHPTAVFSISSGWSFKVIGPKCMTSINLFFLCFH